MGNYLHSNQNELGDLNSHNSNNSNNSHNSHNSHEDDVQMIEEIEQKREQKQIEVQSIDNHVFLFCFKDDDSEKEYYTIPYDSYFSNEEIKKLTKFFTDYGNDLTLKCSSICGYVQDKELIEYPEWKLCGKPLSKETNVNYKQLKKLVKSHPEYKIISSNQVNRSRNLNLNININIKDSLEVNMIICFASEVMCKRVKNILVN